MDIWISPSILGFMQCPRCLWLHHRKVRPPKRDFEDFNLMDKQQKMALPKGTDLSGVGIPGTVAYSSAKVVSKDFGPKPHEVRIIGEIDIAVDLFAGGVAIVDLKTGKPKDEKIELYTPQCSSYAYSMIHTDRHEPVDVRAAYLLNCWPTVTTPVLESHALVMQWSVLAAEVPLGLGGIEEQVAEIARIATLPKPPQRALGCGWCSHAAAIMAIAAAEKKVAA